MATAKKVATKPAARARKAPAKNARAKTVSIPAAVDDELAIRWDVYKRTADGDAREKLILHYAPLVKYVASRVASGLPSSVDQHDLVSYGMFGLIDALEKFEPGRGNKFETYAIPRIEGAIIDELRAMDWVPGRSASRPGSWRRHRRISRPCSSDSRPKRNWPTGSA